jgi:hypothetical protein
MAQRTIIETVDDIDGTIIPEGQEPTVKFGLDGATYEIDLNDDNRDAMHRALEPWIARARRLSGPKREKPKNARSKEQTQAIRQWAIDSGYQISDRGRIPGDVEAKFHEVNGVPLTGKARPKKS